MKTRGFSNTTHCSERQSPASSVPFLSQLQSWSGVGHQSTTETAATTAKAINSDLSAAYENSCVRKGGQPPPPWRLEMQ